MIASVALTAGIALLAISLGVAGVAKLAGATRPFISPLGRLLGMVEILFAAIWSLIPEAGVLSWLAAGLFATFILWQLGRWLGARLAGRGSASCGCYGSVLAARLDSPALAASAVRLTIALAAATMIAADVMPYREATSGVVVLGAALLVRSDVNARGRQLTFAGPDAA